MSEVSDLALFVRVVEDGSFSAAARFFGMMPSSVSRAISQLETELGTRLFHRTTRRQHLTEAGEIYLEYAQRIVADIDSAKLAVSQLAETPSGSLTVAIEADFANFFIAPFVSDFLRRYPDIQIKFVMNTKVIDLVNSGIDIAIRIGDLNDSSLYARKIGAYRQVTCASPEYLKKHGTPKLPDELSSHNCLAFDILSRKKHWGFQIDGEIRDISVAGSVNVNNLVFLRKAALANVGVTNIPLWMVYDDIEKGDLVLLLEDYPTDPLGVPVHAVFSHSKHLAPKVRAFIDYLMEQTAMTTFLNK